MDSDSALTKKDKYFLQRAMGLALASQERHKHGSIIIRQGRVISWGINSLRNHPSVCSDPKAQAGRHAEREAIRKANTNLEGSTLYVARTNREGQPLNSKPCKACAEAIKKAGIKKVVWTW